MASRSTSTPELGNFDISDVDTIFDPWEFEPSEDSQDSQPEPQPSTSTSALSSSTQTQTSQTPPNFKWNDVTKGIFSQSFVVGGFDLKPAGVGRHFAMLLAHNRFTNLLNQNRKPSERIAVDVGVLWRRLGKVYDMEELERLEQLAGPPFPNETNDFNLPEEILNKRIRLQSSEDICGGGAGVAGGSGGKYQPFKKSSTNNANKRRKPNK